MNCLDVGRTRSRDSEVSLFPPVELNDQMDVNSPAGHYLLDA